MWWTHSGSAEDARDGSEDEVGVLVGHERDDEVGEPQTEKAPSEDWFGRVQVGHSSPEEQERGKRDTVRSLADRQQISPGVVEVGQMNIR